MSNLIGVGKEYKENKCVTKIPTHQLKLLFPLPYLEGGKLSQIIKRKSTPETRAGQYMCSECGQIFDTKKEVDHHLHVMHS